MNKHTYWLIAAALLCRPYLLPAGEAGDGAEVPVTVTVLPRQPLHPVAADFPGFSYEVAQLTDTTPYLHPENEALVRMLRNLGPGLLRIGGNTSDKTGWTGAPRTSFTGKDSLTTTDIDRFAAFAERTGWKVLFGLNLGTSSPEVNAGEARYVAGKMKNTLSGFQIGNEPDLYYKHLRPKDYEIKTYETEWLSHYRQIKSRLPEARFAGPAAAGDIRWFASFMKNHPDKITLLTAHYYNSPGQNAAVTWKTMLAPDLRLSVYLQTLDRLGREHGVPYRMGECNSMSRGGKAGVSNLFASALWGLDYMWMVALHGGQGVNFHGGSVGHYAPIVAGENGRSVARPLYYAMLAFRYASEGGTLVPAVISPSVPNSSAYACVTRDTLNVTLLNKSEENIAFTVRLDEAPASVKVVRLTAPSPESLAPEVRFGGSRVKPDGGFGIETTESIRPSGKQFEVSVPAWSAAVVVICQNK